MVTLADIHEVIQLEIRRPSKRKFLPSLEMLDWKWPKAATRRRAGKQHLTAFPCKRRLNDPELFLEYHEPRV